MKSSETSDPKSLLDILLAGGPTPVGIDAEDFARARVLAESIHSSPAAEVEQLPEPLALAVVEASVRARDPSLPDALASSAHKALAKAAKKALYQLRSFGVVVPERRTAVTASLKPPAVEELPCLLSSVSGSGEQAVLIPRLLRGGGMELLQLVASDEKGIIHLEINDVGRSAYRKQLREIRAGRAAPAVEIQRDEAREILGRAAALNLESGAPYPSGTEEALRHLGVTPRLEELQVPPPEPEDERLSTQAAQLHAEPEMQPWLPPEPQIRLLAAKMDQVTHSPLELTEAQRSEQVLNVFRTAAREFFTPEMQKLYARRLWRMASFFERTGRARQAQIARAEARRLFHNAAEPFSRFAEFLFEKVLWLSQRAQAARSAQEPVASELADEARSVEERSPGGLILP